MLAQNDLIQKIIDQIVIAANLGGLPEGEEKQFREKMAEQIYRRLGLIIMGNLDEKGLKVYQAMIKDNPQPNPVDFQNFLKKYLPDYETKIKQGMGEFIKEVVIAASK